MAEVDVVIRARDAFSKNLNKLDKSFVAIGKSLTAFAQKAKWAAAIFVGAMGFSIKAAVDFEHQMVQVATLLGKQATSVMPGLAKQVEKMSVAYGEGTKTLSKGLFDIISASIPASKAIGVLEVSVRSAKAGFSETAVVADVLTTIINSYGLAAEDAADVSDLLFAIAKKGKTTMAQLAPVLGQVASTAAQAGLSIEEMGASLATMTRSGLSTNISVTALRAIINAMLKPADEAAILFEDRLGVAMNSATLAAEGLTGIVKRLKDAQLTPDEVAKLFPQEALSGMNILIGNHNALMDDLDAVTNRAGETNEAFAKVAATSAFALGKMWQMVQQVRRELGVAFLPIIIQVGQILDKNKQKISEFAKALGKATADVVQWVIDNRILIKDMVTLAIKLAAITTIAWSVHKVLSTLVVLGPQVAAALKLIAVANPWLLAAGAITAAAIAATEFGVRMADAKSAAASLANTNEGLAGRMNNVANKLQALINDGKTLKQAYAVLQLQGVDPLIKTWAKQLKTQDQLRDAASTQIMQMKAYKKLQEESNKVAKEANEIAGEKEVTEAAVVDLDKASEEKDAKIKADALELAQFKTDLGIAGLEEQRLLFDIELEERAKQSAELLGISLDEFRQTNAYKTAADEFDKKLAADASKRKKAALTQTLKDLQQSAQNAIAIAFEVLGGEVEAFKQRKELVIALIAIEKALAIARIISDAAKAGPAGILKAATGIALVTAQFATQVKAVKSTTAPEISGPTRLGGGTPPTPTGGGVTPLGEAPRIAAPAAQAAPTIIFKLGSVSVTMDIDRLETLEVENTEQMLKNIGEAVKDRTVEGFNTAIQIVKTGLPNINLAVS